MTAKREGDLQLEEMSLEELREALEQGRLSIQELRENESVRQRINRMIVKRDMEEHSDIYERLAEV